MKWKLFMCLTLLCFSMYSQQQMPECGNDLGPVVRQKTLLPGKNRICSPTDGSYTVIAIADTKGKVIDFRVEDARGKEIPLTYPNSNGIAKSSSKSGGKKGSSTSKPKDPIVNSDKEVTFCWYVNGIKICANYF